MDSVCSIPWIVFVKPNDAGINYFLTRRQHKKSQKPQKLPHVLNISDCATHFSGVVYMLNKIPGCKVPCLITHWIHGERSAAVWWFSLFIPSDDVSVSAAIILSPINLAEIFVMVIECTAYLCYTEILLTFCKSWSYLIGICKDWTLYPK